MLVKYTLDYKYLVNLKKFESKMNDGNFDSFGQALMARKRKENRISNFLSDMSALLKSV